MTRSKIEWTEETWNPTTGCDRISPGCDHCYALTMAGRLKAMGQSAYQRDGDPRTSGPGFGLTLHPERMEEPFRWTKPRVVFVDSMSDLFHPEVPDGYIAWVWYVMQQNPAHTFQVLTKRSQRMRDWLRRWEDRTGDGDVGRFPPLPRGPAAVRVYYCSGRARLFAAMLDQWGRPPEGAAYPLYDWMEGPRWWPAEPFNVWVGTSIESDTYTFRADHLRATPAAIRFLSLEPLIGPLPSLDLTGIDWVIVGGESGAGARPMDLGWVRELRGRCAEANVALFVKQLGSCWTGRHHRDLKGGKVETFPEDLQIREMPR